MKMSPIAVSRKYTKIFENYKLKIHQTPSKIVKAYTALHCPTGFLM
jgi:hypothetical protein